MIDFKNKFDNSLNCIFDQNRKLLLKLWPNPDSMQNKLGKLKKLNGHKTKVMSYIL